MVNLKHFRLCTALVSFIEGPPFTLQRVCEVSRILFVYDFALIASILLRKVAKPTALLVLISECLDVDVSRSCIWKINIDL